MQILTTQGYKPIEYVTPLDDLIAYDINTGQQIINHLISKTRWTHDMLPPDVDEEGKIIKTSEQVFDETYGPWKFYEINGTWVLFHLESIWTNSRVVHVFELQIGDIIYDGNDNDVVVTSIVEVQADYWWRLSISGDHSYIADNLTLHNANRYWVNGNVSPNWNATTPTNWGSASGTLDNASVPGATDDVFFDGGGTSGNSNSTISATITILSLTVSAGYTSTITHNAVLTVAGNLTFGANQGFAGASAITVSAASTITSNGRTWPNNLTFSNANTKTLNGNLTISGTLVISGATLYRQTASETSSSNGLTMSANLQGATNVPIILTGGTLSGGSELNADITFAGNVTISGSINFYSNPATGPSAGAVRTIRYQSGQITTTGSIVSINIAPGVINFDTFGMTFATIQHSNAYQATSTWNLISRLDANILGSGSQRPTFSGTGGFDVNQFLLYTNSNATPIQLTTGATFRVRQLIQGNNGNNPLNGAYNAAKTLSSTSATTRATLILDPGGTSTLYYNLTRIDASGGRTINLFVGNATDCVNVRSYADLPTAAEAYFI